MNNEAQRAAALAQLEQRIGYHFNRPEVLFQALDYSRPEEGQPNALNRTAFFGDSVLRLCARSYLREHAPAVARASKEVLCAYDSALTRNISLAALESYIHIASCIQRSPKMKIRESTSASAMEAMMAAVYLDSGGDMAVAESVFQKVWEPLIHSLEKEGSTDRPGRSQKLNAWMGRYRHTTKTQQSAQAPSDDNGDAGWYYDLACSINSDGKVQWRAAICLRRSKEQFPESGSPYLLTAMNGAAANAVKYIRSRVEAPPEPMIPHPPVVTTPKDNPPLQDKT